MYDNKKGTDSVEKKTEKELLGAVEAILFAMGESVSLSKIASAIGKDETEAKRLLEELKKQYQKKERGIRGVSSDPAVNLLVEYDLVCEVGRLDSPGIPLLFGTTEEFLRRFGVQSVEELPSIAPEQLEDFKEEAEREIKDRLDV